MKWDQYAQLYGSRPERIELLNEAAPLFARITQDTLWESTLLNISRLTDRPNVAGHDTLTLNALPAFITDDALRAEIVELLEGVCEKVSFARDWRDRRLAHTDCDLVFGEGAEPLAHASRLSVKQALAAIVEVMNRLAGHYFQSQVVYDNPCEPGGAESLLYVVRDGVAADSKRRDRLHNGIVEPEDLLPPQPL